MSEKARATSEAYDGAETRFERLRSEMRRLRTKIAERDRRLSTEERIAALTRLAVLTGERS